MSKRGADEDPGGVEPPTKKIVFEPLQLGSITNLEELDVKTLQFQNRKLGQRLALKNKMEEELRGRIDQLEKRQTQDDAVINVINRYWNQLNEDIRILLQRFDTECGDENEKRGESEATTSFLSQLATWHKEELDEKLASRVQAESPSVDETVRELNTRLQEENRNLHQVNTKLHNEIHFISLKNAEMTELLNAETTKAAELINKHEDSEYELSKLRARNDKLETMLLDSQEKLAVFVAANQGRELRTTQVFTGTEKKTIEELQRELEDQRELAQNRMGELEGLNTKYKECMQNVEKLRMDLSTLPEYVVVETTEHKCLQSQFSVLYNEAMQLKTQLEENRSILQQSKNSHMRQIEQMESEELLAQKKLRTEVIQLEDMLAQVRKEYEMLRIEFEQNLAANEQTGPINKEMRNLITTLQTHNTQLKGEVARYKRKQKEKDSELAKLRKECDELRAAEIRALKAKKEEMKENEDIKEEIKREDDIKKEDDEDVKPGQIHSNAEN
ncbi:E3 ubiquitin-protein ligase Bre1 [Eurytemora carolleeae]|uniref:E3 ubiquitin-protein ligase Bre1 n=1 Tax=Eurytemora carolleeae TaxID=1294199 RepID=UPI000C785820|nr:E3 ubiquitin-protein ligase Bre1 [Eurytemora carolleeae]|eukprot:XP_023342081.1 E3 ubiquitin-protein ligase Bre1-like [Eurytemora affinis]